MKTRIIYEDKHLLVCYKPAGLATQTAKVGQQDVVSELKNYLKQPYLGVIHRLDQPVEGLLVFAKEKQTAAALTARLADGTLNKQYYAVLCGKPDQTEGRLVDYLAKEETTGNAVVVDQDFGSGKEARLSYRTLGDCVLSTGETLSLADIHIETGRFHQIRVQMSHAGYPLIGDSRYGNQESLAVSKALLCRNVALCAYHLSVKHPVSGKDLKFTVSPEGRIFRTYFPQAFSDPQ